MKRLVALVPALLLALPALAQEAPEGAYKNLWCGIAFSGTAAMMPALPEADVAAARAAGDAATEEQTALVEQADMIELFRTGGEGLIAQATEAYKGAGFTDEQFTAVQTELKPKVETQIQGPGDAAEFTYEQCLEVLPQA